MKRGDVVWRMKGPVLALTWMDKKAVHATGTYPQAPGQQLPEVNREQQNGTIEKIPCPELVSSYNTYMGGVDKNDQMKSYYPIPVAGKKWWSRILLIDPFTTALYLSKNLHTMQNGVRSCSGLTLPNSGLAIFLREESVEGPLMSIY